MITSTGRNVIRQGPICPWEWRRMEGVLQKWTDISKLTFERGGGEEKLDGATDIPQILPRKLRVEVVRLSRGSQLDRYKSIALRNTRHDWLWTFTNSTLFLQQKTWWERPIIMCNYLHFLFSFGAGTKAFSDTGNEKGIASLKLGQVKIVSG